MTTPTIETVEFPALKETDGKLEARRKELAEIFAEAGDDVDLSKVQRVAGGKDAVLARIRELNAEMDDLGKELDKHRATAKGLANSRQGDEGEPGDGLSELAGRIRQAKTVGDLFVESVAFKNRSGRASAMLDIEMGAVMRPRATLFETGAGWAPESTRSGLLVPDAQRPVQVTDLLPTIPWTQAAYKYMEETTFTNNAAEVAEGGTYGEAAFVLTERSVTIEKVGVWIPVTDEQLEDVPGASAYLNARLPFMLRQRVDSQILVGNGTTPNILGINNKTGIQTQAKGTDPTPDAVYKAMTKVRVTGRAMPSAVIFHPNDWQDVRLLRTSDGIYIWGNPSEAGPERIWGVTVVQSDAQTENTAVVGDFANYSLLVVRRGIETKVTDSHSDFFINGKQAIRADVRLATVWLRPEAFATVTGI